jgi:hypothetical protein
MRLSHRLQGMISRSVHLGAPRTVLAAGIPSEVPYSKHLSHGRASHEQCRSLVAVLVIALVVGLITLAVKRHEADVARQAAEFAAKETALEHASRTAKVQCFVVLAGNGTTQQAVAHSKRYPCRGVPVDRTGVGTSFWTVVTVKGVPSEAAGEHGVWLYCVSGESGMFTGRSDDPPEPGADMRAVVAGTAVDLSSPLDQLACEVRTNHGVVRKLHVALAYAGSR